MRALRHPTLNPEESMQDTHRTRRRWQVPRLLRIGALALGLAVAVGGCDIDDLLDVEAPDRIPAEGLATPQNADLLVAGALGDFECAFSAYVALSAVMAREMTDATQTAARWPYDRRNVQPTDALYATFGCTALGIYTPLSTARWSAENILRHLQGWTDDEVPGDRQELIATAAVVSGYTHLLLGEGFCSGVLLDDNLDPGGEVASEQLFGRAIDRLETALSAAQAAGNDDLVNLARVGLARTHLNLGNGAQAIGFAEQVPVGFVYEVTASTATSRRYNRVFSQSGVGSTGGQALSVGENYRNVTFAGEADPRIPVIDTGETAAVGTPIFLQAKYESLSDPLPLATWREAQLIIAEVEGGARALEIIQMFHARAGLDEFQPNGESIEEHVIEERRRELWLEGHRFHDIRRLNLALDPAPGTPNETKGGVFGDNRCFPLPDVERHNNPNL